MLKNIPKYFSQIQSRGQVIAFKKMSVEFSESDLRIREEDKLIPLETTPEGVILGSFVIPITLSEKASPEISVSHYIFLLSL